MKLTDLSIPERYDRVADRFTETVAGVTDWDAPTPVKEWRARDVVGHLVGWLPSMVSAGAPIVFEEIPPAATDPVGAWASLDRQLRALLADPGMADVEHVNPHTGTTKLPQLIDQYFTSDVFMHTWDLARSSGQEDRLDDDQVAAMLAGFTQIEEMLRASGQFGTRQPVSDDATTQEQFIAFIGRDPHWTR